MEEKTSFEKQIRPIESAVLLPAGSNRPLHLRLGKRTRREQLKNSESEIVVACIIWPACSSHTLVFNCNTHAQNTKKSPMAAHSGRLNRQTRRKPITRQRRRTA